MERSSENADFIRNWSRDRHLNALTDENKAHWIVQTLAGNHITGYVIFIGINNPDKSIEFKRIVIDEKNKGYGRETVKIIKKVVFEKLGAHRLWLEVMENNPRARHLYESEGFIVEGIHRESLRLGDSYLSLDVMSMLVHEYKSWKNHRGDCHSGSKTPNNVHN